jgi:hypothetical protein
MFQVALLNSSLSSFSSLHDALFQPQKCSRRKPANEPYRKHLYPLQWLREIRRTNMSCTSPFSPRVSFEFFKHTFMRPESTGERFAIRYNKFASRVDTPNLYLLKFSLPARKTSHVESFRFFASRSRLWS